MGARTHRWYRLFQQMGASTTSYVLILTLLLASQACAQSWSLSQNPELEKYFEHQVTRLENANELTQYKTLEDWQRERPELRKQLFDMLGLSPLPKKTPMHAKVIGTTEHPEFIVERLYFQSIPGLYVTANLYLPRSEDAKTDVKKFPTILYVCGHAKAKKDGVSYGNKTYYQHHGAWFARNGYVCLIIDTLQRGEIEGAHHGTYRLKRWWWNSRGYTPAGLETWNCIRALDYLQSRDECDMERVGVTGRSGGGVYSWWLTALDDRVHCAVPVAGITSMRDQVMTGCVEGHCDCMFMLNTYQWNFAKIAALVAPRPLLISNTDKDPIFPLEGVVDVHRQVRHIFRLYDAGDQFGLQITEGPHADTQELHIHAFRWFNRFLKGDQAMVEKTAEKFFAPELLKVFETLPTDELNTHIDELFVPAAETLSAETILHREDELFEHYQQLLLERCFLAWPETTELHDEVDVQSIAVSKAVVAFKSEPHVPLRLAIQHPPELPLDQIESINLVIDLETSPVNLDSSDDETVARLSVRSGTLGRRKADERKLTHIRRRYQLLGTTLESMQVWDIRRGIQILRKQCPKLKKITISASEGAEPLVLLASLFESPVDRLIVPKLPAANRDLPSIFNLTRTMPAELLPILAARRSQIVTKDSSERHKLLAEVLSDPIWSGREVTFATHQE